MFALDMSDLNLSHYEQLSCLQWKQNRLYCAGSWMNYIDNIVLDY